MNFFGGENSKKEIKERKVLVEIEVDNLWNKEITTPFEEIKKKGFRPIFSSLRVFDKKLDDITSEEYDMVLKGVSRIMVENIADIRKKIFNDETADGSDSISQEDIFSVLRNNLDKKNLVVDEDGLSRWVPNYKSLKQFPKEKQENIVNLRKIFSSVLTDDELLYKCMVPKERVADYVRSLVAEINEKYELGLIDGDIQRAVSGLLGYGPKSSHCSETDAIIDYTDFSDRDLTEDWRRNNLYGVLCEYADDYHELRYYLQQVEKTKIFFKNYFPEFYKDISVKVLVLYPIYGNIFIPSVEGGMTFRAAEMMRCFYDDTGIKKDALFQIEASSNLKGKRDLGMMETFSVFDADKTSQHSETDGKEKISKTVLRKNQDFHVMLHEYFHLVLNKKYPLPEKYWNASADDPDVFFSSYRVWGEGISILGELIADDIVLKNAEKLGLSKRDIADFEYLKQSRLRELKSGSRLLKELAGKMEVFKDDKLRNEYIENLSKRRKELVDFKSGLKNIDDLFEVSVEIDEIDSEINRLNQPELRMALIKEYEDNYWNGRNFYDGIFKFTHKLYKKFGMDEYMKIINNLDVNKIMQIRKDSEEYNQLLGNPDLIIEKYCKN